MRTRLGNLSAFLATAVAVALAPLPAGAASADDLAWEESVVDSDQSFRGLDAVDSKTAWVSGGSLSGGAGKVYRTTDGGETWQPRNHGLTEHDVYSLEAVDAQDAPDLSDLQEKSTFCIRDVSRVATSTSLPTGPTSWCRPRGPPRAWRRCRSAR